MTLFVSFRVKSSRFRGFYVIKSVFLNDFNVLELFLNEHTAEKLSDYKQLAVWHTHCTSALHRSADRCKPKPI
jgi:hypothetical protein